MLRFLSFAMLVGCGIHYVDDTGTTDTGAGTTASDTDTDTDSDTDTDTDADTDTDTGLAGDVGVQDVAPGELVITEIMKNPAAVDDAHGEWFEVTSLTEASIDLKGLVVSDLGGQTFTVGDHVVLPIAGIVVFGADVDASTNGGVNVDVAYDQTAFQLANGDDEVILSNDSGVIDEVAYDDLSFPDNKGYALSLDPGSTDSSANDDGANWCTATSTFGDGDYGTPGATNDSCAKAP